MYLQCRTAPDTPGPRDLTAVGQGATTGDDMTSPLQTHPPELLRLEQAVDAALGNRLMAALHLALPTLEPASCSVRLSPREIRWREARVARSGDDIADALLVAHLGHKDGDQFYTLAGQDLASWVKVLTSGRRNVAYGSACLLGLPPVVADLELAAPLVVEVLRQLHTGQLAIGECSTSGVEVRGSSRMIALRATSN